MSRNTFETLEKLIQENAALRAALSATLDMPGTAQSIADAAAGADLNCSPAQISEFLSEAIARGLLPITENELDSVAAGAAKLLCDAKRDPYWSDADLPPGASPANRGYQGKSS